MFLVIIPIIIPGITKFRQISKIYTGSIKKISPKITIAKDMKIPLVSDNAAITTNNEETLIVNILNAGILTATNIIIIVNNVITIV